jgi:copper chaperone CopZ
VVELEVKIEGMKCGGCSSRVEEALSGMAGVAGVRVDLDAKLATVDVHAPSLLDAMNMLPQFVDAIKVIWLCSHPMLVLLCCMQAVQ